MDWIFVNTTCRTCVLSRNFIPLLQRVHQFLRLPLPTLLPTETTRIDQQLGARQKSDTEYPFPTYITDISQYRVFPALKRLKTVPIHLPQE